eukprot:scaffold73883_cov54-Attheya_sp.AAC.3
MKYCNDNLRKRSLRNISVFGAISLVHFLISAIFISSSCWLCSATDKNVGGEQQNRELLEWIQSHTQGFVNEKLQIRLADADDPASGWGLFVTDHVTEGELLYSVPLDLTISVKLDESTGAPVKDMCRLIYALEREARLGDESQFAPYLTYFDAFDEAIFIENWSKAGKGLFEIVRGTRLPPQEEFLEKSWLLREYQELCKRKEDPLEEKAALYVYTRMDWDLLVPLHDLVLHGNGHHANLRSHNIDNKKIEGLADRDIESGEQILRSYNLCGAKCNHRQDMGYGTPELLRQYGIVEQMPQLWKINFGLDPIMFDLEEVKDAQSESEFKVSWHEGHFPSRRSVRAFREELERLGRVTSRWEQLSETVDNQREYDISLRYLKTLAIVISQAIQSVERNDTTVKMYDAIEDLTSEAKG